LAGRIINETIAALPTIRRDLFTRNLPNGACWTTLAQSAFVSNFLSLKQLTRNGFLEPRPLRSDQTLSRWGTHDT
jgi:hypothetical protein